MFDEGARFGGISAMRGRERVARPRRAVCRKQGASRDDQGGESSKVPKTVNS
jgi:hypothetical protein